MDQLALFTHEILMRLTIPANTTDWFPNGLTSADAGEEREMALLEGSHPPGPSRQGFTRFGSSSLCVGDHYCSLRRQVSSYSFLIK
ncbi:hypothetical protein OUZ56_001349 [Daphnia magna]|uniref:Uncharacterized protein n=1 Tax=Daphnia magna TaxID=35525 RepID=A0ABR0A2D0_9CRUS|nr:hypothetical protein OUZ56_001349 [Daphnia magna]